MPNSRLRSSQGIETVGQPAAQRPGDGDADHQRRGVHHGRADGIHMPPVDQIDRHRRREEGEGAEGHPVKVRHQPYHYARTVHGDDFTHRSAFVLLVRRIGRKKPVDQRHQQCSNGEDREYQAPAVRAVQDAGNQESNGHHADRDSDIAQTKDAKGCTLLRFGVPGRYMSVADHEARASESEQRPQEQKGVVAVGEEPGKQGNGEGQKQKRENCPAAELVRQDAERNADGGREKGLHRS